MPKPAASPVAQALALELATIRYTTRQNAGAHALLDMLQQGITPPAAPPALVRYTQETAADRHREAVSAFGKRDHRATRALTLRWQARNLPTQSR